MCLTTTPERAHDLLEQTHEVAWGDDDRRLTTGFAVLAIPPHLLATMHAARLPGISVASDQLRETRLATTRARAATRP